MGFQSRFFHLITAVLLWATALPGADGSKRYFVKYSDDGRGRREIVFEGWLAGHPSVGEAVEETSYPQTIAEHAPVGPEKIVEVTSTDSGRVKRLLRDRGVVRPTRAWDDERDDITTLVTNGPVANRIDLVFMGDGYTAGEKTKFLDDVKRLTRDMFEGPTFHSYLPLFNVHAVFRSSKESGIGKNDKAKDTAYGLYRQGNTLRAIFASKPSAANASCRAAPDCDYPIIVANDPFYGGLGGQFAITTSSVTSGTMVLRHELGHNFGRVGEEYDGANTTGYYGANHDRSLRNLSWKHWIDGEAKSEPAIARYVGWPWHDLAKGAFPIPFSSDGEHSRYEINVSLSGMESDDDIEVRLDGERLALKSPGYVDRAYHTLDAEPGFAKGQHKLEFREGISDGNNMLSNLTIHEFGQGYHYEEGFVGAFPLYSTDLEEDGFRPTHATCLMRDMTSKRFCPVCQENNWLQFLSKVSVVDEVKLTKAGGRVTVTLETPEFSSLDVRWLKEGSEISSLLGKKQWSLPEAEAKGKWRVEAVFRTPEVRHDPKGLLKGKKDFRI